jgi:hypothetical protein
VSQQKRAEVAGVETIHVFAMVDGFEDLVLVICFGNGN